MVLNLACSAALLVLAAPGVLGAFHQHLPSTPAGWSVAKVKPQMVSSFTLALTMQNIDQLESMLVAVSTPGNAQYGKFKDDGAVQSLFAPSKQAVDSVTGWLKSSGITKYKVDGAFIDFATDVATANRVFNASYQHYSNGETTKLRTLSFSIPDSIQEHIQLIDPGNYFGGTKPFRPTSYIPTRTSPRSEDLPSQPRQEPSCQTSITPACLKELYNVGDYTPKVSAGSRIGFASFLNQSALYSDVALFEQVNGIPAQNFSKVLISGGVDDQDPSHGNYGEADLDAENIIGIAHPLPVTEYITGGSP